MTVDNQVQDLIDKSTSGITVKVPEGTYDLDVIEGGITPKSGTVLDLTGVTLRARPVDNSAYRIIRVFDCEDVEIIGGLLIGERLANPSNNIWARGDLMGNGIDIRRSGNIKVRRTQIRDCMGDGILVWHAPGPVEIDRVVCDHNRRQGMSIVDGSNVHVHHSQFSRSGGTPPGCGIDVENDSDAETCANILIEKNVFYGNSGSSVSFGSPGQYRNCRVTPDNDFDMVTQPIWAAGNAGPLGTSWWAFLLNRTCGQMSGYRWWGYRTEWYRP